MVGSAVDYTVVAFMFIVSMTGFGLSSTFRDRLISMVYGFLLNLGFPSRTTIGKSHTFAETFNSPSFLAISGENRRVLYYYSTRETKILSIEVLLKEGKNQPLLTQKARIAVSECSARRKQVSWNLYTKLINLLLTMYGSMKSAGIQ